MIQDMPEEEPLAWPKLPMTRYISGRLAGPDDVDRGDAVFYCRVDDSSVGEPDTIEIPQYAYLLEDSGRRIPVVVVQAEISDRGQTLGLRDALGQEYVATKPEVTLLGRSHP
jgi:hypothetical protein